MASEMSHLVLESLGSHVDIVSDEAESSRRARHWNKHRVAAIHVNANSLTADSRVWALPLLVLRAAAEFQGLFLIHVHVHMMMTIFWFAIT